MSLSIPQRYIIDLENFTWGEDWRAIRIIKEKRTDGEYYFASIVRYYGEKEDTHDYDLGETHDETELTIEILILQHLEKESIVKL